MTPRVAQVAALLFGSGLTALIYQVVWFREFRLIFGASTASTSAVLAVFMGGLGVGGILFGPIADRSKKPLTLYANLELAIALLAAATPFLVAGARWAYTGLGGSFVLGGFLATIIRLLLSVLILGIPAVLMGGTLPAAARAVATSGDKRRQSLAILYGINTIGAVTGTVIATFVLLEVYGAKNTLWMAAFVNALVGLTARVLSNRLAKRDAEAPAEFEPAPASSEQDEPSAPRNFVLFAAGAVGFAFFLMELVWYRMLAPILGGSTYTFGLILAVALAGIGIGGTLYATRGKQDRPTLLGFALTCSLEALFIGIPFAIGDRLAWLAMLINPLATAGFLAATIGWTLITLIIVFPVALIAGIQFPLLVGLLGTGKNNVGKDVGWAYAFNTLGSILGALAGGFGAMVLFSAPGTWRLVIAFLAALSVVAAVLSRPLRPRIAWPISVGLLSLACLLSVGPTAVWRHSAIGAGRDIFPDNEDRNGFKAWQRARRSSVIWERDGRETSVALRAANGVLVLIVNGKSDGSSLGDAGTQIMSGLLGAALHPSPERALVIGQGTGETAGWLAQVDGVEHVDVVELEHAVQIAAAEYFAPFNHDVGNHPKITTYIGDGRELLLTTKNTYDVIFSEPSNPYRAGVASLYTQEFYESAAAAMSEDGIFIQFLQTYEVDAITLHTVYATVATVFPHIETWQTLGEADLALLCSRKPIRYDLVRLRKRLAEPTFRRALNVAWRTDSIEGFFAHYTAGEKVASAIAEQYGYRVNTDDQNLVEYGFARTLGRRSPSHLRRIRTLAYAMGVHLPPITGGELDRDRVEMELASYIVASGIAPPPPEVRDVNSPYAAQAQRIAMMQAHAYGQRNVLTKTWEESPWTPETYTEKWVLADTLSVVGDADAERFIESIASLNETEAHVFRAQLSLAKNDNAAAGASILGAFKRLRRDAWIHLDMIPKVFAIGNAVAKDDLAFAQKLYAALATPLPGFNGEDLRRRTRITLARQLGYPRTCLQDVEVFADNFPWDADLLEARIKCFHVNKDPRLDAALADAHKYNREIPEPLGAGLSGR